jgi:hypothetical protein
LASGHGCGDTPLLPQEPLFRDGAAVSRHMHMAIMDHAPTPSRPSTHNNAMFLTFPFRTLDKALVTEAGRKAVIAQYQKQDVSTAVDVLYCIKLPYNEKNLCSLSKLSHFVKKANKNYEFRKNAYVFHLFFTIYTVSFI